MGNDVVDLATDWARRRWEDTRFLDKVFIDSEQKAIRDCPEPDVLLWSLWACKEASYKVLRKLEPDVPFLPRRYRAERVVFEDARNSSGTVDTPFGPVQVRVEAGEGFVHCIGRLGNLPCWDRIVRRVLPMETAGASNLALSSRFESMRIREVVREHVSGLLGCDADRIDIVRRKGPRGLGPPTVRVGSAPGDVDVSLSHDGRFLAFAVGRRPDPGKAPPAFSP